MAVRVSKGLYSGPDRISVLPEGIIEKILVFLPLKEAARTSVLSKNWRYIWTQLPELLFDRSLCNDNSRSMLIVSQVLLRHIGFIHKFTLSLFDEWISDIDRVACFVCNNALKDFNLDVVGVEHHKLAAHIFSCRQLENLYLGCCIIRPPPGFNGFGMLKSLKFYNVEITGDVCSSLISGCPQLEKLTLKMLPSCGHLDIEAPNLRIFHCEGCFMDLCFKDAPQLEKLLINLGDPWPQRRAAAAAAAAAKDGENLVVVFDGFPALKYVELTTSFLKCMIRGTIPERLQNELSHLKAIKLHGISFEEVDEARRVLYLIRSSPNLEKITIHAWSPKAASEPALEAFRSGGLSDLVLNKLREVVMVYVSGKPSELLLIEILLAKSPMLEKMVIRSFPMVKKEKIASILGKVMQFERASPRAWIKCSP